MLSVWSCPPLHILTLFVFSALHHCFPREASPRERRNEGAEASAFQAFHTSSVQAGGFLLSLPLTQLFIKAVNVHAELSVHFLFHSHNQTSEALKTYSSSRWRFSASQQIWASSSGLLNRLEFKSTTTHFTHEHATVQKICSKKIQVLILTRIWSGLCEVVQLTRLC